MNNGWGTSEMKIQLFFHDTSMNIHFYIHFALAKLSKKCECIFFPLGKKVKKCYTYTTI